MITASTRLTALLDEAVATLAPLRQGKPGVALCFASPDAERLHQVQRDARRALANAREEARYGGNSRLLDEHGRSEWDASTCAALRRAIDRVAA